MVIKTLSIENNNLPPKYQRRSQSASCSSQQRRLPDAEDLRRMCIITKSDLNRIYDNLDRRQREKDLINQEIARRNELAQRSAQVTKNWQNTIAGAREHKLEMKKIREQQEEERKKQLDIEEEKLAAERRREQIEKAKQLKYYETDRVRTFHSALLFTEVLQERQLQIDMKKRIEQMRHNDEEEVRQRYLEAQNQYEKLENEKRQKKLKDRFDLSKYQLAQIEQKRIRSADERRRDRLEGEEYRQLAEQHALEQMELERFRKLTQNHTKKMYDKAFEDKQKIKQIEQELDEEENDELRVYAEAKKKIVRLRREKEIQANQEKQIARDHMVGYLGSLQKRAEADSDTQMFRAHAEREAKELREEQEKLDKQKNFQQSINKYRQETMKRREIEKEIEERANLEVTQQKAEADRLYYLYQQEKDKKRNQDAQKLSEFHLKQTQERKERERGLKTDEIEEVQLDKHMNEVDRQQFQDYTQRVISYLDENGRNTYPLKKVYVEEMKRFDQFNQGSKKTENQDKNSINHTKKHLGFQWEMSKK